MSDARPTGSSRDPRFPPPRLAVLLATAVCACVAPSEDNRSTGEYVADAGTLEWAVGLDGVGPLRFGEDVSQLARHFAPDVDTAVIGDACTYVAMSDAPDSVAFMLEGRRLVRVDVSGAHTPTLEGARVGDAEATITTLYPNARREPHKYTDGFYLVVLASPTDTLHRYVFETDGRRVTRYRAGIFPPVAYVEGCS